MKNNYNAKNPYLPMFWHGKAYETVYVSDSIILFKKGYTIMVTEVGGNRYLYDKKHCNNFKAIIRHHLQASKYGITTRVEREMTLIERIKVFFSVVKQYKLSSLLNRLARG